MSIYASTFDCGFEHANRCERIEKIGHKMYKQDDSKPCTCGSAPIKYEGSHILPSDKDERDGYLCLAAIPGHISHGRRKAISDDYMPYHPWLRVCVNDDTVVLTRKQVVALHAELSRWISETK